MGLPPRLTSFWSISSQISSILLKFPQFPPKDSTLCIVGKTRKRRRHVCAIFQPCCAIFASGQASTVFFAFCCGNYHLIWMNRHPVRLRDGQPCLNGISCSFEANFELLLLCSFFAWAFCLCYFLRFFRLWHCVTPVKCLRIPVAIFLLGEIFSQLEIRAQQDQRL